MLKRITKTFSGLALIASCLAGCGTQNKDYVVIDGMRFRLSENFLAENRLACMVERKDIIKFLSMRANQNEFQVAYFPDKETLVNLTIDGAEKSAKIDNDLLEELALGRERFDIIHNHSNINLDPRKEEKCPLYWLAASPQDINQYTNIASKKPKFTYGIISEHGYLTMTSDGTLSKFEGHPFYIKLLIDEAKHMQDSLVRVNVEDLESWAKNYKGIFSLSFKKSN